MSGTNGTAKKKATKGSATKAKDRACRVGRNVRGGCFTCHGTTATWFGPNAHGVAVRHHDATGHETWVDVSMSIRYGGDPEKKPTMITDESVSQAGKKVKKAATK